MTTPSQPGMAGAALLAPRAGDVDARAVQRKNEARAFLFCLWSVGDDHLARRLSASATVRSDLSDPLGRVHVARAQVIRALRRKRIDVLTPAFDKDVALRLARTLGARTRMSQFASRASYAVIAALARQPLVFRDALVLALLFGFSTAETADALALPYPRALALINEGKMRLNVEFLRSQSQPASRRSHGSVAATFESGLAETFRLTQRYIDASALTPAPSRRGLGLLRSLGSWLPMCAATLWFAVPVFAAVALGQCLMIRAFEGDPELETASAPDLHVAPERVTAEPLGEHHRQPSSMAI